MAKNYEIASKDETRVLEYWSPDYTFSDNVDSISDSTGFAKHFISLTIIKFLKGETIPSKVFNSFNRETKRDSYDKFITLANKHIKTGIYYVGLPALAAPQIYKSLKGIKRFTIYDKNPLVHKYLKLVYDWPKVNKPIYLFKGDVLKHNETIYNVFDYDLMCHISYELINNLINTLYDSSFIHEKLVVGLTTSYGHGLFKKDLYEKYLPYLDTEIKKRFSILENISGTYCDRHIPMQYTYIALQNNE